ncbi:VOC family protein [Atlantibacter sp. RC6]|uniref:VOC family protein n=1 Tax=Atlantibacter sp. RC6 TaxID=2587036 RepID=UPI0016067C61|nr:VOC family protein [Atlantibacter sp. RC6]MBB3323373.1 catechol 2,3-dioxygenase-like lactoylglutathione lyase family enzyme [Atlantibacter sp. RC6]
MTFPVPMLDHVVINVASQLDEASALYRRLGFQLTERGHHTLGSSNHLAIFDENYLELLGFEPGRGDKRQDLWEAPLGLTGLVWKTQSADAEYSHLEQQGLDGEPPAAFHRPVRLPDGQETVARFKTVRLRPSLIPNGRSFFCQHQTPHAVWQPAWQEHPNGVKNISEFVIVAQDPAGSALVYSRLFGEARFQASHDGALVLNAGKATVRIASEEYARRRFGALPEDYNGTPRMAGLSFLTADLQRVKASLQHGDIPFREQPDAIIVEPDRAFNLALRFHR